MLKRAKLQWCHIGYYIDDVTLFSLLRVCIYNAKTQVAEDCEQAINERMKAQHDVSCDMGMTFRSLKPCLSPFVWNVIRRSLTFAILGKWGDNRCLYKLLFHSFRICWYLPYILFVHKPQYINKHSLLTNCYNDYQSKVKLGSDESLLLSNCYYDY